MNRFAAWALCALLVASCRGGANNVVLASLDRSERIDLFCAEGEVSANTFFLEEIVPLELCDSDLNLADDFTPQFLGSVTQTESGTLVVVNFTGNRIFDTSQTVPGVTAIEVGEQPTAVQVSSVDSRYTYVTSFSPKTLQAISTREVITGSPVPDAPAEGPILPRQEIRLDGSPTDLVLYESASSEPILNEEGQIIGATTQVNYRYLFVAVPETGEVLQVRVDVDNETGLQTFGDPVALPLATADCTTNSPVPGASTENDYNRICPQGLADNPGRLIKAVETTPTCAPEGASPGPSPVSLTFDPGDPEDPTDDFLLVADANQPIIHRFPLFSNGAVPGGREEINTGAPTLEVDVTPYVPATSDLDDRDATQRYLYAISALDSSILAVDYTPDDAMFGALLPVIAGQSPRANEENIESRNRVRSSFSNARSIEVIAPSYRLERDPATGGLLVSDDDPDNAICDPTDPDAFALAQNPRNMRGVFLSVSLSSGSMFFLDIYDLNAPCRGGDGLDACTPAEIGQDQFASIRRHRRRWGFTPSTFISIDGTPSLQFNAAPGVLDETTGEATASDGPGLEFIECPADQVDPTRSSMINVFGVPPTGSEADGLICASSQVWSSFTQRWDARWQGLIPSSEGGLGLFSNESFQGEPGDWFLAGDVPFCRVGVLGEQSGTPEGDGTSIDLLRAYGGDRLVITGELPPNTRDDEACKDQFEDLLEDIDERQVWFPIIRAFNDQLELGPSERGSEYDAEVRRCFNQFTEYQIHTRNVYTVVGTSSSFINAVVPDPTTGECIFDPERVDDPNEGDTDGFPPQNAFDVDTYLTGRAFPGAQFTNPLVSFQISEFDPRLQLTDSTVALLNFNILNQFTVEVLDTGGSRRSLPASLLYAPERDQLFFVDFHAGVRRIVFSPLSIVQTFD